MESRRWVNPSQPRTLAAATILLYAGSAFNALLSVLDRSFLSLTAAVALLVAAYLTANAQSFGWLLGVGTCMVQVLLPLWTLIGDFDDTFGLWFFVAMALPIMTFALLVHPESRDQQRAWFT